MGFSAFYGNQTPHDQAAQVISHAFEKNVILFNTATFYGPLNEEGFGANLRLIKHSIQNIDRSKIQLMVKICMDTRAPIEKTGTQWILRADAEGVRADVDYALEQLGVDYIDIIVLCRVSPEVPIEETVAAMQQCVTDGKARHIGLSEAAPHIIRRANAIAPIYCIEQEWSLWSRDIEDEILPTCRELGIKIIAYSPLGRGFLTGSFRSRDDLGAQDYRKYGQPKFNEENFEKNLARVDAVKALAEKKGCTVGQLALAFLHSQGPDVIPIPGTTSIEHLDANLAARSIVLTTEELAEIDTIFDKRAEFGERYAHMHLTYHGNPK